MDLGIRGKTALVCAASKGLGKGCATSLAREGVNLVITARGKEALEATADEIRSSLRRKGDGSGRRHHHAGRPRRGARGLPRARHPGKQRRRPAARRFPRRGRARTGSRRSTPTC